MTTPETLLNIPARESCFWGHEWSMWEMYRVEGKKVLQLDHQPIDCTYTKQRRVCLRCNYMEVEHVSG